MNVPDVTVSAQVATATFNDTTPTSVYLTKAPVMFVTAPSAPTDITRYNLAQPTGVRNSFWRRSGHVT